MSRYKVYVTPAAWKEIKNLPGQIRQRPLTVWQRSRLLRRARDLKCLVSSPRYAGSGWIVGELFMPLPKAEEIVDVLAVRKRPPYDYGDLESLLKDYPSE